MKNSTLFLFTFFLLVQLSSAQDSLFFNGAKFRVDTTSFKHDIGLGAMYTSFRLPDVPLNVHVVELDLTNPYLKVQSNLSNDTLRDLEAPSRMAIRKTSPGHRVVTAINGDFYNITSGSPDLGMPVNGHATNGQLAKIPSPTRDVIAFGADKTPYLDVMTYMGKFQYNGQSYTINNINTARGANQLILFNQYNGKTTKTNAYGTEVVLQLAEGSWAMNKQASLTVKEIRKNLNAATIQPGEVVLSGHGTAAAVLNGMAVGQTLTIDIDVAIKNGTALPELMELIGGDRTILRDGVITNNNWAELHPRSAAGFSADKKTFYLMMVEGRAPLVSNGVSTAQLAQLMVLSGASTAINFDGGGSSSLVVHNEVANASSDGSERRVANVLMFISEAPVSAAVDFKLNTHYVQIPFGNKFQFSGSTYNESGDIVDYQSASNITYTVEGAGGTIDASGLFTATGHTDAKVVATWNGKTETAWISITPAKSISFSTNRLTIDHLNNFDFKVYGSDNDDRKYLMNNDLLKFQSSDETIGTIDANGVFKGLKDGVVTVRVATKDDAFEDFCTINVEVGRGHLLLDDFSDPSEWTITKSWVDNVDVSRVKYGSTNEDVLKVVYSMTYAKRTAYINFARPLQIYGMPDSLILEASGSGYKTSYMLTIEHPSAGAATTPIFSGTALDVFRTPVQSSNIPQIDFPLSFQSLRLTIERDNAAYTQGNTYEGTFYLKSLKASYPEKDPSSSSQDIHKSEPFSIYPQLFKDGVYVTGDTENNDVNFNVYNFNGQLVFNRLINFSSEPSPVYINLGQLPKGVYIYSLVGKRNKTNGKLVRE